MTPIMANRTLEPQQPLIVPAVKGVYAGLTGNAQGVNQNYNQFMNTVKSIPRRFSQVKPMDLAMSVMPEAGTIDVLGEYANNIVKHGTNILDSLVSKEPPSGFSDLVKHFSRISGDKDLMDLNKAQLYKRVEQIVNSHPEALNKLKTASTFVSRKL